MAQFFFLHIDTARLADAESKGSLFEHNWDPSSPGKRDKNQLREWAALMAKHLQVESTGLFVKSVVQEALAILQGKCNRNISSKTTLRIQSANYLRYYSEVRKAKKI